MTQKEISELSDQELLVEIKKIKSSSITNAFFIGLLIGIIFYSVIKSSVGLVTLLPLFMIYKLTSNSKNNKAEILEKELKARNLDTNK